MRSRVTTRTALATAALVSGLVALPAAQAAPAPRGEPQPLHSARPVFWDGSEDVDAAVSGGREQFLQGWTYPLHVQQSGERLRLGLDVAVEGVREWADGRTEGALGSRFVLELLRDGEVRGSVSMMTGYSVELVARDVQAGTYAVRVRPADAADYAAAVVRRERGTSRTSFRLRAALESAPPESDARELLPNLRIIAPFEIGFHAGTYTYGPGASLPHDTAPTCMGEEYEEEASEAAVGAAAGQQPDPQPAARCLRFSAGIENVGAGPLVIAQPDWPADEDHPDWWQTSKGADFPAYQRVLSVRRGKPVYTDGELGSAGSTRWHPSHGHFHFENAYGYVLYRLGASPRAATQIGAAQKRGFNPGDEKISRWRSFDQCPMTGTAGSGTPAACEYDWLDGVAVLGVGWGDVYEWNRSGQYAAFPVDAAGRAVPGTYLLVGTADPQRVIRETDETDNDSYAVFTVTGDDVVLRERGYGSGPRDPHRRPVRTAP